MTTIVAEQLMSDVRLQTGDIFIVPKNVSVLPGGTDRVSTDLDNGATNVTAMVDGSILVDGNSVALSLVGTSDGVGQNSVVVSQTGAIISMPYGLGALDGAAVNLRGSGSQLQNWGLISGPVGASMYENHGGLFENHGSITSNYQYPDPDVSRLYAAANIEICGDIRLINTGTLSGAWAILVDDSYGTILNSGAIIGTFESYAAIDLSEENGAFAVRNLGEITGLGAAAVFGAYDDVLNNTGLITGAVSMGAGADMMRSSAGVIEGAVAGGSGNDTLIGGAGEDNLAGGADDDLLRGNGGDDSLSGGDGADRLFGGEGADSLTGGVGRDLLTGGGGDDLFRFATVADSPLGQPADAITDFTAGADLLDLSALAAGDLVFMGSHALAGGGTGSVRYAVNAAGHAVVTVDADGDRSADFRVVLHHVAELTAGDFIL